MKDEFKSEYITFEENTEIKLQIISEETKSQKFKKDKETGELMPNKPYFVWELTVINLSNGSKGKISLFKNKVAELYKILDKATNLDNKTLINSKFSFTNKVTETNNGKVYDLIIKYLPEDISKVEVGI
jgi:hypothetical protein